MANPNLQQLLVDTDAYCKLSVAGLFTDATTLLGVPVQACGRLAALPYMLRRGGLRRMLGDDTSDTLAIFAERIPLAVRPHDSWLDPLTSVASIDPGEAQLLAAFGGAWAIVAHRRQTRSAWGKRHPRLR